VYYHSYDESEKCKQMLNDKEFVMPIPEGRKCADVDPKKNRPSSEAYMLVPNQQVKREVKNDGEDWERRQIPVGQQVSVSRSTETKP
jgi:hypothetical protein